MINPSLLTLSLPACSDPQVFPAGFSPLLRVSAPTLWFPSLPPWQRICYNLRVAASADARDRYTSTEQEQTPSYLPPLRFPYISQPSPQIHGVLNTDMLCLPPHFTTQLWTPHCTAPQQRFLPSWASNLASFANYHSSYCFFPDMHLLAAAGEALSTVVQRAFWRPTSMLEVPASLTAASNSLWCALSFELATLKSVLPVFAVNRYTEGKPY